MPKHKMPSAALGDAEDDLDINLLAGWWQWWQGPLGLPTHILLLYPVPHLHPSSSMSHLACVTSTFTLCNDMGLCLWLELLWICLGLTGSSRSCYATVQLVCAGLPQACAWPCASLAATLSSWAFELSMSRLVSKCRGFINDAGQNFSSFSTMKNSKLTN